MVEVGSLEATVSALAVCPSTGNLLVAAAGQLSIFRYILSGGNSTAPRQAKFIDFEVNSHDSFLFLKHTHFDKSKVNKRKKKLT